MIKKLLAISLLLTIFFLPLVLADDAILSAREADIDLVITSEFELVPIRANAEVTRASAILSWVPYENRNQRIVEQTLIPDGLLGREAVVTWSNPSLSVHELELSARLVTNNQVTPVRNKVLFPIQELGPELIPYTRPSELINTNEDIVELARTLAQGSDDLYEVVFRLAEWTTTNIEYNLTTMTAEATHPSSWVLENRYGVCDELTNLFISLNRALGIPARFVSGLAYTNDVSIFADNWGGHGWAEVYFPGSGWVPYDVTYATYGYIPSGHIKLKDGVDSGGSSVDFEATGRSFSIESKPLGFDATINRLDTRAQHLIGVAIEPYFSEVGFGSHNLLLATITNNQDYYVAPRISVGNTQGLFVESTDTRYVMLAPREEKTIPFLVRVEEDLDSSFQYTFPVSVRSNKGVDYQTSFVSQAGALRVDKDFFDEQLRLDSRARAPITISCLSDSPVRSETTINCSFVGEDNRALSGLACIDNHCVSASTPTTIEHTMHKDNPGLYTIPVRFETGSLVTSSFETIQFVDEVRLEISNLTLPKSVRYDEQANLSFVLEQTSVFGPEETTVIVETSRFLEEWSDPSNHYSLSFPGAALRAGDNELTVRVSFVDVFGEEQQVEETVNIRLVDLSVTERVNIWLFVLQETISSWFNN